MLARKMIKRTEMMSCLLCKDAPCSAACPKMDTGTILRHIWFDNEDVAALSLPGNDPCADCDGLCEKACVRP
ncbi:MAG: NAD-dependent dihydropyrimidine dehydrogenase subunit PreA, partial [Lachnospiraceae bacterium]|nr:NAD-dependent dihydropyrimidine dehydrogenase subunit PreA [Lachnospiraceae bacterium]